MAWSFQSEWLFDDEAADGAQAMTELDGWVDRIVRRCASGLAWSHVEQCRFVFDGLLEGSADAAMVCERLLSRVDALEYDLDRVATRGQDLEAVGLLAERGMTTEERRRIRRLVEIVKRARESMGDDDSSGIEDAPASCTMAADYAEFPTIVDDPWEFSSPPDRAVADMV